MLKLNYKGKKEYFNPLSPSTMPDKDPLEQLLDQIAIALTTIYANKDNSLRGQVPANVTDQIRQLEEFSNLLEKSCQEALEKSKNTPGQAAKNPTIIPENIDPKAKEMIEKTNAMLKLISGLRRDIIIRQKVLKPKPIGEEDRMGLGKKRKKAAAKNIGYKGWQKL